MQKMRHLALVVGIILALAGPAQIPTHSPGKPVEEPHAPSLLPFTSGGHVLGFAPEVVYAATGRHTLRVEFLEANHVYPQATAATLPVSSPSTSTGGTAPILGRVTYPNLWEGVTLTYVGDAAGIYTTIYRLAPGAAAKKIRLRYNAPLSLNEDGTLSSTFEDGRLTESAPIAWQEIDGRRVAVEVAFQVEGQEVGFSIGKYDSGQALTIDPTLIWTAYLGGNKDDWARGIAVDGSGFVYVAGNSYGTWGNPMRGYSSDRDGFVAKLDAKGGLVWNAFLGGAGYDAANAVALDGNGNVYVAGDSTAIWFCRDVWGSGCTRASYSGGVDAYAAKLDQNGNMVWNTFMESPLTEYGTGIAVDPIRNAVYVVIDSNRVFVTPGRYDFEIEVNKFDLSGNWIKFSAQFGSAKNDFVNGVTMDGDGNVYIVGFSEAGWGGPVRSYGGGLDAFVVKLNSNLDYLWHTFLGASGTDRGWGIAVDGSGKVYVTGDSNLDWGSPVRNYQGGEDAFVAQLDAATGLLGWNTFLGGGGNDSGRGIGAADGRIYVSGYNPNQAFASMLSSSGALLANLPLNGSLMNSSSNGLAVGNNYGVYVAGAYDTIDPYNPQPVANAFVSKVDAHFRTHLPILMRE